MNLLIDSLPEKVTVSHTEYQVRSHYRDCLRIMLAFEDAELTNQEKQVILLSSLFVTLPPDLKSAIASANWFLNGGNESKEETDAPRLFSFTKDAQLIYSAFRQTHGIDLSTANLHWWQFLALFMDLGQDTTFCQLVALRKRIKTGKATKEERAMASAMGELFDVPDVDTRTLEQKDAERRFFELVHAAEARRKGTQ